jgi:hypothetical protein
MTLESVTQILLLTRTLAHTAVCTSQGLLFSDRRYYMVNLSLFSTVSSEIARQSHLAMAQRSVWHST